MISKYLPFIQVYLTPKSIVLPQKLTDSQVAKKFFKILWITKDIYHFQNHWAPAPILSQINPVHASKSHFFKDPFLILFSYMPRYSNWSLFLSVLHQIPLSTSPISQACYMPQSSYSSRFDPPNIW